MRHYIIKLALLSMLAFAAVQTVSQQPQSQNPPSGDQSQTMEPAEAPPHVDVEPNPEYRALEQSIKSDLNQDPQMAYSNVRVQVTDTAITLTGTVITSTAKAQAEKIASAHAGSKQIDNQLDVNPNLNPGPGL